MHCASQRADDSTIPLESLPETVQRTLKVFDRDDDGTLDVAELTRAADMYKDSQSMVKRLRKVVVVLFLVLVATIGVIVGLTAVVVEESKEAKVSSNGVQVRKGASTPVATGDVTAHGSIY